MPSMNQLMTRVRRGLGRRRHQTSDPNFIGFDKYAKHGAYHWHELSHNGDYQAKANFVRARVEPGDHLIDLGCGDGAYLFSLAPNVGSVTGIDADYDAVLLARKQLQKSGVTQATVEQLPLSAVGTTPTTSRSFDLAYSMDVIEHLPDPTELLEVAARVVRPGGLIIVGTPLFIRQELVSPYHVKEFTREEISGIMHSVLQVVEEHVLPEARADGRTYESFYVSVCRAAGT